MVNEMKHLRVILPLWLFYLILTANFELSNWVVGLLVAAAVSSLIGPRAQWFDWKRLPVALWATVRYLATLAIDLIVSGVQVARIVLTPSLPIEQGIIAIPAECESDIATALSAHAITLTPGGMVVEIDDENVMYTHVLDVSRADEHVLDPQQKRWKLLQKVFV